MRQAVPSLRPLDMVLARKGPRGQSPDLPALEDPTYPDTWTRQNRPEAAAELCSACQAQALWTSEKVAGRAGLE